MNYDDRELVYLAQEGNEDATNIIYEKYKPIIVKKSKNAIIFVTHHGIEINDIMQEAYIGLEEAIRNYSQDSEATFYTFACICIDRQIFNLLRKLNCSKDKILNEAIMIDDNIEKSLIDSQSIEENMLGKDNSVQITNKVRNILTDFEKKVFDLAMAGYSFEEIAKMLNKEVKSIYNSIQRIKVKFKKIKEIDN